ncbi:MAG: C39 family peptidase [Myxococcota bacterium]|nr:C39 family peptidase [Myxococcota bacterium]
MAAPINLTSPRPPVAPQSAPRTEPAVTPPPATRANAPTDTFEAVAPKTASGPVLQPTPPAASTATTVAASQTSGAAKTGALPDVAERNGFPWISQLDPEGVVESVNAEVNCAPAVFAMVARKIGFGAELDDASLIDKLGQIGGTQLGSGTSMNGVVAMARAIGLPVDQTEAKFPGFDGKWLDEQLAKGKSVVANGAMETDDGPSGHYILVTGKGGDGKYKINDPWNASNRELTAAQLKTFLQRNPVHHGASVALG